MQVETCQAPEYQVIQGPYTCNGSPRGCERERFGGCLYHESKEREKAEHVASQLRRMADWLESHPDGAAKLMSAEVRSDGPRISLYSDLPLVKAFAGQSGRRFRRGDYQMLSLKSDGILFEGYGERVVPPDPEEQVVTL